MILPAPLIWEESGEPRSAQFGDVYFSRDGGLAEAREVFLNGCGLPDAWVARDRYCVAELGFGTGLNLVALLDLWQKTREPSAHLSLFSLEAHPLSYDDAARALSAWPEVAHISRHLLEVWPRQATGFHRVDLPQLGAHLDLAIGDVHWALDAWRGQADAWFLDGFSPALNPQMWTSEVFQFVARRSAPAVRVATYSVAGAVRRGLAQAGFEVSRLAGFGKKRERLEAVRSGQSAPPRPAPRVAIVGGGIAAASLKRAFAAWGVQAQVAAAGAGIVGKTALVSPRLDAGLGPQAALFAQAFARAVDLYTSTGAVLRRGGLQLATRPKDPARYAKIAASDLFAPGAVRVLSPDDVSQKLGTDCGGALWIDEALVVAPDVVIQAWLGPVVHTQVLALERVGAVWHVRSVDGQILAEAEVVCLAAGMATATLSRVPLPMTAVRGQSSFAAGVDWPLATIFGAYLAPTDGGLVFGATHDRGDCETDARMIDHQRNLSALQAQFPQLAARLSEVTLEAHVGIRAATPDYLPLAGAVEGADGLFVLSGLGSRGFTLAPLLAEHVAACALGEGSPLPGASADQVDPARFAARARRRGLI